MSSEIKKSFLINLSSPINFANCLGVTVLPLRSTMELSVSFTAEGPVSTLFSSAV